MEQSGEQPQSTYDVIREEVLNLFELSEEEFSGRLDALIQTRLTELESSPVSITHLDGLHGNYQGFLHPSTEVNPVLNGTGFRMDDPATFEIMLKQLRRFCGFMNVTPDNDENYQAALLQAVQYAQQEYFGNIAPGADELKKREQMVWRGAIMTIGESQEIYQPASIAEFKEIAMCAERAAVANNLLQFMGMEPVLVAGKLETESMTDGEPHAYLVIEDSKGKEVIFDPSNPILVYDHNGHLMQTNVALYAAPGLLNGQGHQANVKRSAYKLDESGKAALDHESSYVYTNSFFGSELHPH